MPALSAQTQLASLRGALEAARQREEKHKTEMEKVMKEMETLKRESTNTRRGEVEVCVLFSFNFGSRLHVSSYRHRSGN
jgi:predicted  nucleic acid-binding Zn-ribbon protein